MFSLSSPSSFFCYLFIFDFSVGQVTRPQLFPSDSNSSANGTTTSPLEITEQSFTNNFTTASSTVTSLNILPAVVTSAEASEIFTTDFATTANGAETTDSDQAIITTDGIRYVASISELGLSQEPATAAVSTASGNIAPIDVASTQEAEATTTDQRVTSNIATLLTERYTSTIASTTRRYVATRPNVPVPVWATQPHPSVEINLPGVGPGGGSNIFGDIMNSIAEGVQNYVGQAISSIPLPRFEDIAPGIPPFSLQLDNISALPPPFQNLFNPCPLCETLDLNKMAGTWDIVYASDNFIRTTLKDIGDIADQLAVPRNSPVTLGPRTFFSSYQARRSVSCARIAFEDPIVFETLVDFPLRISFMEGDINRIVAGSLRFAGNGKYLLLIPEVFEFSARLCSSYSNIASPHNIQQLTVGPETIIFVDMGGFPGCTNYIVLTKNSPQFFAELDEATRDYIHRRRSDTSSNPLQLISCSTLPRVQVFKDV